jgi:WD40 repeat protein
MQPTSKAPHAAGDKYEARLRAQHTKLNPRTSWARRRTGDSLEEAEGDLTAGGALARPSRLPKGTLEVGMRTVPAAGMLRRATSKVLLQSSTPSHCCHIHLCLFPAADFTRRPLSRPAMRQSASRWVLLSLGFLQTVKLGDVQVTPLADANKAEPSTAVVRSVEFHPNGQLLLTAGLDKRLRLFQVRRAFRTTHSTVR